MLRMQPTVIQGSATDLPWPARLLIGAQMLFGMIASVGMRSLIKDRVEIGKSRNLIIISLILVFGIGDMSISLGRFELGGIGLAGLVGLLLNLLLPGKED